MRTKKQVFLVYENKKELDLIVNYLLMFGFNFNVLERKHNYVRISQQTFKKFKYIDLYTNPITIFSSII